MYVRSQLLHDDVRRRQQDCHGRDYRKHGENNETESIDNHGGKLPVADDFGLLVGLLHAGRDELQLPENVLQFALRATARQRARILDRCRSHEVRPEIRRHRGRVVATRRSSRRHVAEVVVYVQHVRQQALRRALLELQLLHPAVHQYRLARDLLARSAHTEYPRQPL